MKRGQPLSSLSSVRWLFRPPARPMFEVARIMAETELDGSKRWNLMGRSVW
jgi:hypothetical protein